MTKDEIEMGGKHSVTTPLDARSAREAFIKRFLKIR